MGKRLTYQSWDIKQTFLKFIKYKPYFEKGKIAFLRATHLFSVKIESNKFMY